MSSISGISNFNTSYYSNISSGKRIASAADGAAELAIIEGQTAQINGYAKANDSMKTGKDVLNIVDSALDSITENLHRMRELAIQASNGILTQNDKQNIQYEIDQIKGSIQGIATNTEFNTKKLLDGSTENFNIPTNANGRSISISTGNSTLDALGLADFDVTGDFDLQAIDDALSLVNKSRGSIGAQSNALDYAISYSSVAIENLTRSKSTLEDLDMPKAISEKKKEEVLQQYQIFMLKNQQNLQMKSVNILLS
ncbi:MAG: flagellin FliC5 [Lachnospiraceae bacterium]|nr:flagellin FliC5 [Lachnospiraceae bacterium]